MGEVPYGRSCRRAVSGSRACAPYSMSTGNAARTAMGRDTARHYRLVVEGVDPHGVLYPHCSL